jgi:serine/threonine protein kinase
MGGSAQDYEGVPDAAFAAMPAGARVSGNEGQVFTIESLLGYGGMGAVYRARTADGQAVALKILHERFRAMPSIGRRFAREAKLANRVEHPKVVRVIDAGVADDGTPFLVSELLEGETIDAATRSAGGRLPIEEVVRLADELLDVLEAAHARGVVHRDLKPGNLFRLGSGELRVLDFGLAFSVSEEEEGETQLTGASTVLGTAGFMAPELALGRWDLVDAQSDLWAVAATVLWLTTGKYVHDARTMQERLALAATRPAPAMAERAPELPPALASWLDKGLAFSKRDRFENARRMRSVLPAAVGAPARRARPGWSVLAAVVGGVLAAGVGFVVLGSRGGGAPIPAIAPASTEVTPALAFSAFVDAGVEPLASAAGAPPPASTPRRVVPIARPSVAPPTPAPPPPPSGAEEVSPLDRRR